MKKAQIDILVDWAERNAAEASESDKTMLGLVRDVLRGIPEDLKYLAGETVYWVDAVNVSTSPCPHCGGSRPRVRQYVVQKGKVESIYLCSEGCSYVVEGGNHFEIDGYDLFASEAEAQESADARAKLARQFQVGSR